ncbi:septum formation family protein [Goodfellowiella coeruleoviolacea]|nr:septum formation family protein [Goodfellowiella coeruleoviolacea]
MAGASAGAFALLASSTLVSWPVSGSGLALSSTTTSTAHPDEQAAAGDCLNWTRPDGSDMVRVSCDESHLFEVTGTADISAGYGPDAKFPDQTLWQKIAQDACTDTSLSYLSGKFDPNGKFSVSSLKLSQERWRAGNRTLRCGLQSPGVTGKLLPVTGSARDDQSDVYEPGTCLGIDNGTVSDPVDCAQEHSWEIVGIIDLSPQFPTGDYPPNGRQDDVLYGLCETLTKDYTGGRDLKAAGLSFTWDNRTEESWAAGSHRVNCKVGALLEDKSGLAPWTGSVRAARSDPTGAPMHSGENAPQDGQSTSGTADGGADTGSATGDTGAGETGAGDTGTGDTDGGG